MTRRLLLLLTVACASACADDGEIVGTAKVVDGDSLEIGATRIRLHAIDAPEALQRCGRGGTEWPCGAVATAKLDELVGTAVIRCRPMDTDDYGRTVAVCRNGAIDLGAAMVEAGLARAYVRYGDDYVREEAAARAARRGIWVGEHDAPWEYRNGPGRDGPRRANARRDPGPRSGDRGERPAELPPATPPAGCLIKGNINAKGERIYHVPGSASYEETRIGQPGERWFCTEEEARAAGWRPPRGS